MLVFLEPSGTGKVIYCPEMCGVETCTSQIGKAFRERILLFSQLGCKNQAADITDLKDPCLQNAESQCLKSAQFPPWPSSGQLYGAFPTGSRPDLMGTEWRKESEETLYKLFPASKPCLLTKPWFPAPFLSVLLPRSGVTSLLLINYPSRIFFCSFRNF